ncbi:MAG: hypothetical protein IJ437_01295 [Clostridia bacterium]|nr:hypothetical protein [Clostridia bacterium]
MKNKRILLVIAIVLAFALVSSVFSVFFGIDHARSCENEGCQICAFLTSVDKTDSVITPVASSYFISYALLCVTLPLIFVIKTKLSLIKLKVKLSD